MRFTFLFVFYLVFNLAAGFQEDDADDDEIVSSYVPKFISQPLTLSVSLGDNITLPCELDRPGKQVMAWEKSKQTIYHGIYAVHKDSKMSLSKDYSLQITNISDKEAGEYICRVGSDPPVSLTHTVTVLVAPQVTTQPRSGLLSIKEGDSFSIACENLGNPTPTISWKLEGKPLNIAEDTIRVEKATKDDEGIYECKADNGVGKPSMATVKVRVLSLASPITLNFNHVTHIISWEVDSQSKIEEYSLKYRKILSDGDTEEWNEVMIQANDEKTYKLEGLEQDAKYEAIMTATNKFGTNEPSQVLKFSTVVMSNASLSLKSFFSSLILPLLICLLPLLRSCQR